VDLVHAERPGHEPLPHGLDAQVALRTLDGQPAFEFAHRTVHRCDKKPSRTRAHRSSGQRICELRRPRCGAWPTHHQVAPTWERHLGGAPRSGCREPRRSLMRTGGHRHPTAEPFAGSLRHRATGFPIAVLGTSSTSAMAEAALALQIHVRFHCVLRVVVDGRTEQPLPRSGERPAQRASRRAGDCWWHHG